MAFDGMALGRGAVVNYHWNWRIFWEPAPNGTGTYLDMLLSGLVLTIETAICAWIIALVFGSVIGVLRTLPSKAASRVGFAYVEFFRNMPLLVQLFLWFFVLPEILPSSWGLWLKQMPYAPFYTAAIGIGLFMSARVAEQTRAGIGSLPRGQKLAATALGLTTAQAYRYVLLTLTALAALGGLIFGTLIALMRLSGLKLLGRIAGLYVDLMRSLPLVLVIFWFYFLVPYIGQWLTGSSRPIRVGAFTSSLVTFIMFEAAYFSEIMRAGIQSISKGQQIGRASCRERV